MIKLVSDMLDTAMTEGIISAILSLIDSYKDKLQQYVGVKEKGE